MAFSSPETYISGMAALSIPDEGRAGGDWHFVATFCHESGPIQSAGQKGTLINTNQFLGQRMVVDKAAILRKRGIEIPNTPVFCALHPRAVADLLYRSLSKDIFPAHVILEGGIFEEEIEFSELDALLNLIAPQLNAFQNENLRRWKARQFFPVKHAIAA